MSFDGLTALFHPTPQEYLNGMWKRVKKLPPSPPPRHVRVHVYLGWQPGCDETEFVMRHSALVGDFPLDRAGRLALARVRAKWALRGCAPIDPCRRAKFDTAHPEYISPLAIRVLTETEGVLKLFEPTPSEGTIAMREFRLWLVTAYDNLMSSLHEATLGWLVETIGLLTTTILLTMVTLGVPAALGWYFLSIMGLGFQSISVLQTKPFWQVLDNQDLLSEPVFGFYLERYIDQVDKVDTAPGGTLTLGGTNASFYAGDIEFIGMPNGTTPSYWFQQVQAVTVQGKSISVPSNNGLAAIDTGTLLIAPAFIAQKIWANVPGSEAMNSPWVGFSTPNCVCVCLVRFVWYAGCTTNVTISILFGGTDWTINPADMNLGKVDGNSSQMWVGIFDLPENDPGNPFPSWVIGNVFLKNVYSAFQADPPAIGFARLTNGSGNSGVHLAFLGVTEPSNISPRMVFYPDITTYATTPAPLPCDLTRHDGLFYRS
ncbi:acid protease [Imleria badia]|nr:acid protease [Imleria badia]